MSGTDAQIMSGSGASRPGRFYAAVWRWHFYAGLIVAPFFLIAALSGVVMTLKTPVEALAYGGRLYVEPQGEMIAPAAQMEKLKVLHPQTEVLTYIPPAAPDRSSQFLVAYEGGGHGGHGPVATTTIFVNPYTGAAGGI